MADEEAEKILAAYPRDRFRGKTACLAQIEEAVKEGIEPEDLLQAVQAYATDSAGWLITGMFLAGIVSMMAASLLWTLMLASPELTDLGLTRIDREDATWLVL